MSEQIKHYVEKLQGEYRPGYASRGFTQEQPYVIKARYEPKIGGGGRLHVIEPENIKKKWPTLSDYFWQETALPVGPISEEKWLAEVTRGP